MAKTTLTVVEDDLDGQPGAATVTFALDGKSYEIDLRESNRELLGQVLAPYVRAARDVTRGAPTSRMSRGGSGLSGEQLREVRAWANSQGIVVAKRGRIAGDAIAAYNAAHRMSPR